MAHQLYRKPMRRHFGFHVDGPPKAFLPPILIHPAQGHHWHHPQARNAHDSRGIEIFVDGSIIKLSSRAHHDNPYLAGKLHEVAQSKDAPRFWVFSKAIQFFNYGQFEDQGVLTFAKGKAVPKIGSYVPNRSYVHEDVAVYLLAKRIGHEGLQRYTMGRLYRREHAHDQDPGEIFKMIWESGSRDDDLMTWLKAFLNVPGNWDKLRSSPSFKTVVTHGGRFLASVM